MVTFGSDTPPDEAQISWLDSLPNHAIFTPQRSSSQGHQCMVVRNSDLFFTDGKVLRTSSLLEAKQHSYQSSSSSPSGSYKELVADAVDFDIVELVLNPTGKLLAVVGKYKVVILVLPRTGSYSSKSIGSQVPVKSAAVGLYYYHERVGGKARIAKVKWHPWGRLGSSLLVMSKDGLLREFDVSEDVEEPIQTVSLLPSTPLHAASASGHGKSRSHSKSLRARSRSQTPAMNRSIRSTSKFALDDDDENSEEDYMDEHLPPKVRSGNPSHAVTFTLGIDSRGSEDEQGATRHAADWSCFTIYTVCGDGDLYALCPFLPKNASVPLSVIQAISSTVSLQSSQDVASSVAQRNHDLQSRYITSLLKQARTSKAEQQPFSPLRSRRSISATPMSLDPRASALPEEQGQGAGEEDEEEGIEDVVVSLQAPSTALIPEQPQPQGPFLLSPAPVELSEESENTSTDLFFSRLKTSQASLDMLGVVGDDGRVDLCLLLEAVAPLWTSRSQSKANGGRKVSSSGRYALSDSDSNSDEEGQGQSGAIASRSLPTLFVYETIDLGITGQQFSIQPRVVLDPLYPDSFYIQHAKGAHALSVGRWSKELLAAMAVQGEEGLLAMERVLHRGVATDVVQVVETSARADGTGNAVVGLSIVSDIYLSYSFLALTQSGALVALELGLRLDQEEQGDKEHETAMNDTKDRSSAAGYTSLLGDGPPFSPPEPFQSLNGLPYHPRRAIKDKQSNGELTVSTETLRSLATVVSALRGEMRKIVQGGNVVQSRLELQIKELNRQLSKLSEVRSRMAEGKERQANLEGRVKRVMERQNGLVRKSDHLLQRLVENHSPEVSIYEARWFKELQRLQEDVGKESSSSSSSSKEGESGLSARLAQLQYHLDVLRPDLEKMQKKQTAKEMSDTMGTKQLHTIENLLALESQLLAENRDKVMQLQSRLQRQHMY